MAVAWLLLGIALLWLELHHLAFFALFASLGAFAAGILALVAPSAIVGQGGVFVGVTIAGVVAARPVVSRVYERRHHGGHVALGVHGGLVGQEALTLDSVSTELGEGHARLAGERWLAVSGDGRTIEAGRAVRVSAVLGTTLVVWPTDGLFPLPASPDPDSPDPDSPDDSTKDIA